MQVTQAIARTKDGHLTIRDINSIYVGSILAKYCFFFLFI